MRIRVLRPILVTKLVDQVYMHLVFDLRPIGHYLEFNVSSRAARPVWWVLENWYNMLTTRFDSWQALTDASEGLCDSILAVLACWPLGDKTVALFIRSLLEPGLAYTPVAITIAHLLTPSGTPTHHDLRASFCHQTRVIKSGSRESNERPYLSPACGVIIFSAVPLGHLVKYQSLVSYTNMLRPNEARSLDRGSNP